MESLERWKADHSSESLRNALSIDDKQMKASLTHAKSIFYRAVEKVPFCKGEQKSDFSYWERILINYQI